MMFFLYLLVFLSGFAFLTALGRTLPILVRLGASIPLGLGLVSFMMFPFSVLGIPITYSSVVVVCLAWSAAMGAVVFFKYGKRPAKAFLGLDTLKAKTKPQLNLAWVVMLGVSLYVVVPMMQKTLYWPETAFDAVGGYDYMAKLIAAEGSFENSISAERNPSASWRHTYPLFVPGMLSLPYLSGLETSKIANVVVFVSLMVMVYGFCLQLTGHTLSMLAVLLHFTVPEFLAMSTFGLTNMPHALSATTSIIALYLFTLNKGQKYWLWLGAALAFLNSWTRSEGIFFAAAGCTLLLVDAWRNGTLKQKAAWIRVAIVAVPGLLPLIWQPYQKMVLGIDSAAVFRKELFVDFGKFAELWSLTWDVVASTQLYGITFLVFGLALVANYKYLLQQDGVFLSGLLVSFFIYIMIFYQIDTDSEAYAVPLKQLIDSSVKRGMFSFLPGAVFYVATNKQLNIWLEKYWKPWF